MRQLIITTPPTSSEAIEAMISVQTHINAVRRKGDPIHQAYFDALWMLWWQPDPEVAKVLDDLITCLEYRYRKSKVWVTARPLIYTPPNLN